MAAIKHNQCCSRYTADNALKTRVLSSMSVAMKRHEDRYLQALQTFSRPARELWQVTASGNRDLASHVLAAM
jgi:hypothetical protein